MSEVSKYLHGPQWGALPWIAISSVLIASLTLIRSLPMLSRSSFAGNAALLYGVSAMIANDASHLAHDGVDSSVSMFRPDTFAVFFGNAV